MNNRPVCVASILYIIGIIIGLYLHFSIVFFILLCIIVGIIGYLITANKEVFVLILIIFLGFSYIKLIDSNYVEKYKLLKENEEIKIKAIVVSDPIEKEYKKVYKIKITESEDRKYKQYVGTSWLLNIKKSSKTVENVSLEYGDLIDIKALFEEPREARNYKGFDYKQYLKTKKIYGNITSEENIKILSHNNQNILNKIINSVSKNIKNKIYSLLPAGTKEICVGILIGEREDISEQITEAFKESNLTHMLAVSGAHMSYVVLGISIVLKKLGKRSQKIITILFLCFFVGLTKFTPSVERAGIMTIMSIIATLMYRQPDVYNNLACSGLIILIINPYTLLDIGFQLSYAGTIGIVLFDKKIQKYIELKTKTVGYRVMLGRINKDEFCNEVKWKVIKKAIKFIINLFALTISANLMIIPVMMFNFNTISLTFWVSNIIAGPFIGIIMILGFMVYVVSIFSMNLANIIAMPLNLLIQILLKIAEVCSKLPGSSIIVKTPNVVEIMSYYIIIFGCIFYRDILNKFRIKKKIKYIVICILIINICLGLIENIRIKNLRIYFVDVGQGDCTLIRTPHNKTVIIDGGGSEKDDGFDVGEKTLLPYLLDRRIKKIDYMMISHFDSDHIGGLLYILENISVDNVIISKQGKMSANYNYFKNIIKGKKINVIMVKEGDRVHVDKNIYFDILFPEDTLINSNILNNNSIVAKLHYNKVSMIFTGDIESIAEKQIINKYVGTKKLKTTILKVAHHGSKSSSIQSILNLMQPEIALIGVGSKNTFGHPNSGVLERLKNMETKIYRTDNNGEIEIEINSKGKIKVNTKIN